MSVGVVGLFKVVKVKTQNGKLFASRRYPLDRGIQSVLEGYPVGQVCQRVIMRHVCDALFRPSALSHIVKNGQQKFRISVVISNGDALCGNEANTIV